MSTDLKTAFGLIRVSRSEQDTLSQKEELKRIAEKLGYSILDEGEGHDFFSEKISGFDEKYEFDRDSIVQLKDQIYIRRPDAIFCLELSRLTRTAIKVSHYIDMLSVSPGIPMYFADYDIWTVDPITHERNSDGIMTLYGAAKSVQLERERIRSRTMRGRDAKAERGYYVGHLKDGYIWEYTAEREKKIIIDENRQEMIKTIFKLYLKDEYTLSGITDYLNSKKYPTPNRYRFEYKHNHPETPELFKGYKQEYRDKTGSLCSRENSIWTDSMVSSILKDEWYAGIRRYKNKVFNIDPIVSREDWESCQRRLAKYRTNVSTAQQPYLLGSLMYCGVCGRKLYGHSDGGYGDMYYCSSYEYGKKNKCGLRWIRRQNIEAIVFNIVKYRVLEDVIYGVRSPFSSFFSIDKTKLKDINERIRTYTNLARKASKDVDENKNEIKFLIAQQAKHYDNQNRVEGYERRIDEIEKENENLLSKQREYEISVDKLKKQRKMLATIDDKIVEIHNIQDYSKMKSLLQSVIQRITLYNSDKTSTIIKIEYVNDKWDTIIYNPIRMKKKCILLDKKEWPISKNFGYDEKEKLIVFDGCYLACGDTTMTLFNEDEPEETQEQKEIRETENRVRLGQWNTADNKKRYIEEMVKLGADKTDAEQTYDNAVENHIIWNDITDAISYYEAQGCVVFKDKISVLDFIEYKKNTTLNVIPFDDLLPMSERGMRIKNYHREYQKRYNTGKTFEPFIIKDVDYQEICKKRKHLYNRKYKILKNKHLSQQQKDEQILDLMAQLDAFKTQLKYLPTNKKGRDMIEKQQKTK